MFIDVFLVYVMFAEIKCYGQNKHGKYYIAFSKKIFSISGDIIVNTMNFEY